MQEIGKSKAQSLNRKVAGPDIFVFSVSLMLLYDAAKLIE
jgi:hypothetical protein